MIGYTTIEQSKKLVELGIDADSADMSYILTTNKYDEHIWQPMLDQPSIRFGEIPCWSTEALLKLLPREINDYSLKDIQPTITGKYKISYSYRGMYDEFTIVRDTLCECTYETILKLKELKLI